MVCSSLGGAQCGWEWMMGASTSFEGEIRDTFECLKFDCFWFFSIFCRYFTSTFSFRCSWFRFVKQIMEEKENVKMNFTFTHWQLNGKELGEFTVGFFVRGGKWKSDLERRMRLGRGRTERVFTTDNGSWKRWKSNLNFYIDLDLGELSFRFWGAHLRRENWQNWQRLKSQLSWLETALYTWVQQREFVAFH